ncbi:MAG TPA: response regulator [Candidatus Competibacteraceae bacterium]|nr:response regulator [Candidatus Competibacteraceae bacterium]
MSMPDDPLVMNDYTLLLVDEDVPSLTVLQNELSVEGYRILTAHSAQEALDLLARQYPSVVVADYRLPGMDGNEFFRRIRELYPWVVRIMVSHACSEDLLADAINTGGIYKFLKKPVSSSQLGEVLRKIFAASYLSEGSLGWIAAQQAAHQGPL